MPKQVNPEPESIENTEEVRPTKKMKRWVKILIIIAIVIASLFLLFFILLFIVFPIVFMHSLALQRFFMFLNIDNPKYPDFNHPEKYNIEGVRNFYIPTKDLDGNGVVKIGTWQILPITKVNSTEKDVEKLLREEKDYPILLYLHGVACNRILPMMGYQVFRTKFHVFSIDYRGYGDSSHVALSEDGVVSDNVQVYEWIRNRTSQDIYLWGHSLGGALSINTVKTLWKEKNLVPSGLFVESTFSTMREEITCISLGKLFSWLSYFNATVLDPLEKNKFRFWSTTNIKDVKCPTMHMHSEDDDVIPWTLGEKLMKAAKEREGYNGSTIWHLFSKRYGYKHTELVKNENIPKYIDEFIAVCNAYSEKWKMQNN